MLDNKKFGTIISSMRRSLGISQEKLAELLDISPQAVSKWENGHTLPETSLLPALAHVFGCSVDEIIMPAYTADKQLDEVICRTTANHTDGNTFSDSEIISAYRKMTASREAVSVCRENPVSIGGNEVSQITLTSDSHTAELAETNYLSDTTELHRLEVLNSCLTCVPRLYLADPNRKLTLTENVSKNSFSGSAYDEETAVGEIIRQSIPEIIRTAAAWHSALWENTAVFGKIGLDGRHRTWETLAAHISAMEYDFIKYREDEISGTVPRVWNGLENRITDKQLEYYADAIAYLKKSYPEMLERLHDGRNVTVIHGDMHPGTVHVSGRSLKLSGLQAVRIGFGAEDLAMLISLHIEPERKKSMPLFDLYYRELARNIADYPYEAFIDDCRLAAAEALFFPIKLMKNGIFDFSMRDKALLAYKTWIIDDIRE